MIETRNGRLVLGLLDNSDDFPDASSAARARDLTIAWSRYKYPGEMHEHRQLDELLRLACQGEAGHCLVQSYGHILAEVWRPEGGDAPEIWGALQQWIDSQDFLATGHRLMQDGLPCGLNQDCLLVNLDHYRALGRPPLGQPPWWNFFRIGQNANLAVIEFPADIEASLVRLDPSAPEIWSPELKRPDGSSWPEASDASDKQEAFLSSMNLLTGQLRKGIFVWNLESYEDIETPSSRFTPPITSLYTVSAGFKPNRILQTHGFNTDTRMLVFDYSPRGLDFRRMLHEDWDGLDYPGFLRKLFRKIPPGDAFYLLWDGMTPDNLDWNLVERRWQEEITAWGGEEALAEHWARFRRIRVDYLSCDILAEHDVLLEQIRNEKNALIWWSNAFFSVHSNWLYRTEERQRFYRQWIEKLAGKAPDLLLYGSDYHNVSVNFYSATEYRDWFEAAIESGLDDLKPSGLKRYQMRY